MSNENRENTSFTDEVEAAIDNIKLPDDTAAQFITDEAELPADAQKLYDGLKPNVIMIGDDSAGLAAARRMAASRNNDWHVVELPKPAAEELEAAVLDKEGLFSIDFDESEQNTPPFMTQWAASQPGFEMFKAGFNICLGKLQEFLDEHKEDDDFMALIFNDFVHSNSISQHVLEVAAWANKQDVSDGALQPKEVTTEELPVSQWYDHDRAEQEKRQIDMGDATPTAEKATRAVDIDDYSKEQLVIMLGEQLAINESLQQQQQRNELAPHLWATITDYFNNIMAYEPESQLDLSLIERIMTFVDRIRTESWEHKNANHLNEPDFYELPPILSELLIGQPETEYSLLPGFKLVNLIRRYQKGFEMAVRAANMLNVQLSQIPQDAEYDLIIQKIKENIEDAAKYHNLR